MKLHFCQNNQSEITPEKVLFWGISCKQLQDIDQAPNWKYFVLPKMKSHVNTLSVYVQQQQNCSHKT